MSRKKAVITDSLLLTLIMGTLSTRTELCIKSGTGKTKGTCVFRQRGALCYVSPSLSLPRMLNRC